ncbi:hypothetical protein COCC4DRAFT_146129 [Bipolaris maydis ATCC 48331]|uniref:Uncharacterized protein n=2 Tax=Cochliobolus heterostrophus TaxID=5016 RepID=M2SSI8_COCH5|nr:uncharacterized protein COCC4DRAFT_146129 [Bipolaris maydis ATCC 48331]EMD88290.1 hypothetical protein COCHEDRAFT_1159461 [Bipolaris maydis C5]ENI02139.1 hypothetical protein COCC4DRAFT_146129 [Bipolaris maydis ATCC 48331]
MLSRGRRVLLACLTRGSRGRRRVTSAVASTAHPSFLVLNSPYPSSPLLSSPPLAPLSFAFPRRFPCASLLQPETTHQPIICPQRRYHGPVACQQQARLSSRVAPTLAGSFHAYM